MEEFLNLLDKSSDYETIRGKWGNSE